MPTAPSKSIRAPSTTSRSCPTSPAPRPSKRGYRPYTPEHCSKCSRKFAAHPKRLDDLKDALYVTAHWNETISQRDGTIRRETRFPETPAELMLSGPYFFIGNPFNKTPRRECTQNLQSGRCGRRDLEYVRISIVVLLHRPIQLP